MIYCPGVHTDVITCNAKQHNDEDKSWVIEYGSPWQKRGPHLNGTTQGEGGTSKSIENLLFLQLKLGYLFYYPVYGYVHDMFFCVNEMCPNEKYYLSTTQNLNTGMYKENILTSNSIIHR